ncbi:phosphoribosylaminoimidazolesuccinocarboxamide synthase [Spiribacter aquaticus]|uniref:Phosphoribosylaminoimidazole-succinocarboxamide synthase n=1 Tax=Spiribacter aquaticus TaxID=1935996 RepID=A0A557RND4_9GAMM|nr:MULTISPECIES: phosphoribosylaminoimidazolesuccinocarboxamide synthase [Spiribacter]KAF0279662.1 phosphoribosylaminoimidazolesuccinocarboxamide synthase [Spiribacter roseus]KAF0281264.1 phosphoribosylaminoimidazolesuccinocarboxamide synthase [Spiribacter roseus]TVO66632.1 phosphoribosylaminoimidazolesuccinocarboxamide synthase [Spiribacter aquaticus]
MPPERLYQSELKSLELLQRGKVRDVYAVDDRTLLVVTTDRLSAFDVVLPDPIPGKGAVLNRLSAFWFERLAGRLPDQRLDLPLEAVLSDPAEREAVAGRASLVRRVQPLSFEAIARGYLIGSGWKDYQATGQLCGLRLPAGLRQADRLPEPLFTPSTKAEAGDHDENVGFEAVVEALGRDLAERLRRITLALYTEAAEHARRQGLIIADTKFEFGLDSAGDLVWIDEALTPDSSRFWPASEYRPGSSPPSFDKQYIRDYLETLDWDKTAPAPTLPATVIERTAAKYQEAEARLSGRSR